MKRRVITVAVVLCFLLSVTGCISRADSATPTHTMSENFRGTTQKTQESLLKTLEDIYAENGYVYFNPDILSCYVSFVAYLNIVQGSEQGITFNYDTISPVDKGYSVKMITPVDAWGSAMTFYITMPDPEAWKYELSIVSSGKDGIQQLNGVYDQSNVDACDDVFSRIDGVGQ